MVATLRASATAAPVPSTTRYSQLTGGRVSFSAAVLAALEGWWLAIGSTPTDVAPAYGDLTNDQGFPLANPQGAMNLTFDPDGSTYGISGSRDIPGGIWAAGSKLWVAIFATTGTDAPDGSTVAEAVAGPFEVGD